MIEINWIILSLVAAIINATNLRFGMFFLGEPMVVGLLLGLYLNNLPLGLYVGTCIQFMWTRSIPIGVKVQSNYTVMTFISIYLISLFGSKGPEIWPMAFLAAFILSFIGKQIEALFKRINNLVVQDVIRNIQKVNFTVSHILFLLAYILVFFIVIFAGLILSNWFIVITVYLIPVGLLEAFRFTYPYLVLYSLSLFFQSVTFKYKVHYFGIGLVTALVLIFFRFNIMVSILVLIAASFILAWVNRRFILPASRVKL
jgi:mannose/fructose/N-acetylgalactosamine-specific phosphotransferase system component IIC